MTASDSGGYVVDEKGIDFELLQQIKEVERGRIAEYAERRGDSSRAIMAGGSVWDVPVDIALPSATQNELDVDAARTLASNGVRSGVRGREHALHPRGRLECSVRRAIAFGPGKAANAGGVATSALEMQQNASRDTWSFEYTEERLTQIMKSIHTTCVETADELGRPGDYVVGANVAGFRKVADAMIAFGVI